MCLDVMSYQQHPERLKKSWEFQRTYKKGKKYWDTYFVIYICKTQLHQTRLGITVSKKVGNSVQRNRVKRLIREAFRSLKSKLQPRYDIVVVGRPAAYGLSGQQAQASLQRLFRRASSFTSSETDE